MLNNMLEFKNIYVSKSAENYILLRGDDYDYIEIYRASRYEKKEELNLLAVFSADRDVAKEEILFFLQQELLLSQGKAEIIIEDWM